MDSNLSAQILSEVRSEREKRSNDPITAAQHVATAGLKREALKDVGKVALWTMGIGAGLRGGYGLLNLMRRNAQRRKPSPQMAPMPLPFAREEEEEDPQVPDMLKEANWLTELMSGDKATTKEGIPWARPAKVLGTLAGGYGGWTVVDKILDKRRRQEIESELEEERNKFQQSMLSQFDRPVTGSKMAADATLTKLSADLDALFDTVLEKRALFSGDNAGRLAGIYGMYAVPSALMVGYAAWSAAKKRRRKNILAKAVAKRKQRRQSMQPPEIFATPVPVEVPEE